MKKWFFIIIILVFLPTTVFAHTNLEESSPSDQETVSEQLTEIHMKFDTPIENISTFTLVNEQGEIVVSDVIVENDEMKGTLDQPLPNGTYTVDWKIVGADGHVIEQSFTFTVNIPEEREEMSPPTDDTTEQNESQIQVQDEGQSTIPWMLLAIGILFILLVVFVIRGKRK